MVRGAPPKTRDAADEGRLEASGSTVVGPVIVKQGKVVRASQLIRGVLRTRTGAQWRAGRAHLGGMVVCQPLAVAAFIGREGGMSGWVALIWTVLILGGGPISGFAARRRFSAARPPRSVVYAGNVLSLTALGAITVAIDIWNGSGVLRQFVAVPLRSPTVGIWSLATTLCCVLFSAAVLAMRVRLGWLPSERVLSLLPTKPRERLMFVGVCVVVGVVEEFIFRGFALTVLAQASHSAAFAFGVVTVSFALAHGLQDAVAIGNAFVLGVLLAVPVLVTQSLIPSVVAHSSVDVFAGLSLGSVVDRASGKART